MTGIELFISPVLDPPPRRYLVAVSGEGFFNAENTEVSVRLKGEDTWFDDTIPAPWLGFPPRVGHDGRFGVSQIVDGQILDEDWGEDEIYAIASVQGYGSFRSNTVRRHF